MSGTPTFAAPPTFLGVAPRADAAVVVAGVPFDIGTTNRSGARFGPSAIRHASRMLIDGEHPFALDVAASICRSPTWAISPSRWATSPQV